MNDLRVIENELVPVYVTSTGEKVSCMSAWGVSRNLQTGLRTG